MRLGQRRLCFSLVIAATSAMLGCSDDGPAITDSGSSFDSGRTDAARSDGGGGFADAGTDAPSDARSDVATDASSDANILDAETGAPDADASQGDASTSDAGVSDASSDATTDASSDGSSSDGSVDASNGDAGSDAAADAGTDSSSADAGSDASTDASSDASSDASDGSAVGCGNGLVESGEACDDGNQSNTDGCLNNCTAAACGDSFVRAGVETCDDGNQLNTDACLNTCVPASCGDGFVRAGVEACDDGNQVNTDACLTTCVAASCGDGFIRAGVETCDDGNTFSSDACLSTCVPATCGDGFLRMGTEICDDGNTDNGDSCNSCTPALKIVGAGNSFCSLNVAGAIHCWGDNASGQLGLEDTNARGDQANELNFNLGPVDLGTGRTVLDIVGGQSHFCALLDNHTVKCWGDNTSGQLGLGDTSARGDGPNEMGDNLLAVSLGTGRTAQKIAAGDDFSCAILDNDTAKCWGNNASGQLGQGSTATLGDGGGELGDSLLAINVGTSRKVVELAAGRAHVCAQLDNDSTKCWGANASGQLGVGDTTTRGNTSGTLGNSLPFADLGTGRSPKRVFAAGDSSCALFTDNSLRCWGFNATGIALVGTSTAIGTSSGTLGTNLAAAQLGTGRTAKQFSLGKNHACALLDDGTVKCWGLNTYGALGYGDTTTRGTTSGTSGNNLLTVSLGTGAMPFYVVTSAQSSCMVEGPGSAKCWGHNGFGELGLEDTAHRGDGANEMGDNLWFIMIP